MAARKKGDVFLSGLRGFLVGLIASIITFFWYSHHAKEISRQAWELILKPGYSIKSVLDAWIFVLWRDAKFIELALTLSVFVTVSMTVFYSLEHFAKGAQNEVDR